jgi:hypothetical protein
MKRNLSMLILLLYGTMACAQVDDPGMPGGDPDVPLDGGIALLVLAGAAYGAKKIKDAAANKSAD